MPDGTLHVGFGFQGELGTSKCRIGPQTISLQLDHARHQMFPATTQECLTTANALTSPAHHNPTNPIQIRTVLSTLLCN